MIGSMTSARERIGRRDVTIAALLSVLGVVLMHDNVYGGIADERADPTSDAWADAPFIFGGLVPIEVAIPLFLLVTVPLLWRRVAPIAATGAAIAGLVVNQVLVGTDLVRCGVVLPVAFFFAFTAGAQLAGRRAVAGLALALALSLLDVCATFGLVTGAILGATTVVMWGVGRIVRSRGQIANELEERTAELREARDERARLEVAADRARMSGQLDELLQRRLGELAHMAEEGRRPSDSATATATLVDIERASRATLEEMRAVVGVLRNDSSELPTRPQPTLTHLEALLVHAKGTDARLTVEGNPRVLPATVELSAYRIVEHLLAALEDAPDVHVRVRFADDALELGVSGPARRRARAAIERARERARLQHGTLEATVRGGRADAVASLPVLAVV